MLPLNSTAATHDAREYIRKIRPKTGSNWRQCNNPRHWHAAHEENQIQLESFHASNAYNLWSIAFISHHFPYVYGVKHSFDSIARKYFLRSTRSAMIYATKIFTCRIVFAIVEANTIFLLSYNIFFDNSSINIPIYHWHIIIHLKCLKRRIVNWNRFWKKWNFSI